jgi:uncharacterized protein
MEDSNFIVLLDQIPQEGLERTLDIEDPRGAGIELAVAREGPMLVKARFTKHGDKVLVRGTVEITVGLNCSRCLEEFSLDLKSDLETYLEEGGDSTPEADEELSPEDLDFRPLHDGAVDLRELVAEQVHLALPVKALCSEGCRGLCPKCGLDLNQEGCGCQGEERDPRWEALKKLNIS